MRNAADLFSFRGRVSRAEYVWSGMALFAVLFALEVALTSIWRVGWNPLLYLSPRNSPFVDPALPAQLARQLLLIRIPFVVARVSLTARRLRDIGAPPALAAVVVLPFTTLPVWFLLALCPSEGKEDSDADELDWLPPVFLARRVPRTRAGVFLFSTLLSAIVGLFAYVVVVQLPKYQALRVRFPGFSDFSDTALGVGLFLGIPFAMGVAPGFCFAVRRHAGILAAMAWAQVPMVLAFLVMLAAAFEGIACIVMVLPIWMGATASGAIAGHLLGRRAPFRADAAYGALLLPALAILLGFSVPAPRMPEPIAVTTELRVAAPRQIVWNALIRFPRPRGAPEAIFAIAGAPVDTRIDGTGVGATIHSRFTNGESRQRVVTWDAPHELAFVVEQEPAAIQRYGNVTRASIVLEPNADGSTTMRSTTWVRVKLGPAAYWNAWARLLTDAMHRRLMGAVAAEAEGVAPERPQEIPPWMRASHATCSCTRRPVE